LKDGFLGQYEVCYLVPHRCGQHGQRTLHFSGTYCWRKDYWSMGVRSKNHELPIKWCVVVLSVVVVLTRTDRETSTGPVTDVTSSQIRCYELSPGTGASTYTVNAGDTVGFTAQSSVSHPGPLQFYMAKVPEGKTAATWDGSGNVWFK
jgi:plastocyanin